MKIIDRKALVAALIMACGNGVLASGMDDPFGGLGGGAGAPVATRVDGVSGGATSEDVEWAVASVLIHAPELASIKDRLNKFTASELKRIKFFFELHPDVSSSSSVKELLETLPDDKKEPVCEYVAKFFTEDIPVVHRLCSSQNLLVFIKGIDADEIRARAKAIEIHAETLIPEEGIKYPFPGHERGQALAHLMRLTVDQINAIGENPIILFKEMCKISSRGLMRTIVDLNPEQIRALAVALKSKNITTAIDQKQYIAVFKKGDSGLATRTFQAEQLTWLGLDEEQVELVNQFERELRYVAGYSVDTLSGDEIRFEEERAEEVREYVANSGWAETHRTFNFRERMCREIAAERNTLFEGIRLMADKDAYERATDAQKKAAFLMLTNRIAYKQELILKAQIIASFIIMNFSQSTDDDRLRAVDRLREGMQALDWEITTKNKLLCAKTIMRYPKVANVETKQSAALFILKKTPVEEMNDDKVRALLVVRHTFGDTSLTEEEKGIINEMMPPVPGSDAGGGSVGAASAATPVDAAPAGAGGPSGASGAASGTVEE